MRSANHTRAPRLVLVTLAALAIALPVSAAKGPGGGPPGGEATGNNLSYPVWWAEGVAKTLRGTPGMTPVLAGSWWYWWGTDAAGNPLACAPDPDDPAYCDDGRLGTVKSLPGTGWIRAFLQQDSYNTWQAGSVDASLEDVVVDLIDWGDNLESSDFNLRSMARVEVVLLENLTTPMLEYGMRHLSGWGQTEMHGLATLPGPIDQPPVAEVINDVVPGQATIYSHCARLTIQKLLVPREQLLANPSAVTWVTSSGWTTTDPTAPPLVAEPLFNLAVHQSGDGPGYYSAEINVKGKIVYGYTWNVRRLNDGAGDYRLTFSFDPLCGTVALNTFFVDGATTILLAVEEELAVTAEPTTGGDAQIDFANNLTFIDVRILDTRGGKK
jgi:hypothetical protein